MILIDTHTHIYLDAFDEDRSQVVQAARDNQVIRLLLPNIDSTSLERMLGVCRQFPEACLPMIGLHPTSVKGDVEKELALIDQQVDDPSFIAVGEIGIDLYWDTTFEQQQEQAFRYQIALAIQHDLPIVIHSRNSIDRILSVLKDINDSRLQGVFHCFSGSLHQARQIIEMGFYLGIGGVLTFQKSALPMVVKQVGPEHLLLETDAPFLAPAPYRGKRNESAYLRLIAGHLANLLDLPVERVASVTTENAARLFRLTI